MKLATVEIDGRRTWGAVERDEFIDLGLQGRYPDLKAAIASGLEGVTAAARDARRHPLSAVRWMPVIPNPEKILCVGLNYEMHRQETGRSAVAHPTIFTRFACSQVGHLAPLVKPRLSDEFDYEGELALVIGTAGRYIKRQHALAHVAGFACYNDASVRDFQRHTSQYTPGKNFPATGAFGPWMVTADEVGDTSTLAIQTRVNGRVVQSACFEEMIFDIASQIEYCSQFARLEPGDVLLTGTPGGIGAKQSPPLWLQPGDVVEVEIEHLGVLRNPVAAEA